MSQPGPHQNAVGGGVDPCQHCGAAFVKANAKFCSKCGTKKRVTQVGGSHSQQNSTGPDARTGGGAAAKATFARVEKVTTVTTPQPNPTHDTTATPDATLSNTGRCTLPPPTTGGALPHSLSTSPRQEHTDTQTMPRSTSSGGCKNRASSSTRKPPHRVEEAPLLAPPAPAVPRSTASSSDPMETLTPTAEEEARYSAWSTIGPDGLTPEALQTSNVDELRNWQRGDLIGRGTYGSVYLGLLSTGRFYAVKCVELGCRTAADMNVNVKELVSLSREINVMQRLTHPNLCRIEGVLYEPVTTSICLFLEYVSGGSLTGLVKRFKPLPPTIIRQWTRQLLTGLLYLHSQHIIHRDIKGENVLIDIGASPASLAQVKLVDFGAARLLTDKVTQRRTVIGTPYWMAPEVVDVHGEGNGYSFKADVWSVGCTVAEMITGMPPWPARANAPSAIMMIAKAEGMPTEIPKDEATPGCYDFMTSCFVRDPNQRPTVEELLQHPWILGDTV